MGAIWAEQHAPYTWFLHRKESNLQKLKSSSAFTNPNIYTLSQEAKKQLPLKPFLDLKKCDQKESETHMLSIYGSQGLFCYGWYFWVFLVMKISFIFIISLSYLNRKTEVGKPRKNLKILFERSTLNLPFRHFLSHFADRYCKRGCCTRYPRFIWCPIFIETN